MKKLFTIILSVASLAAAAQCYWPKVYNSARELRFQFTPQGDIIGQFNYDNFTSNFNHIGVPTIPAPPSGFNQSFMKYTNDGNAIWALNENFFNPVIIPFDNGRFFLGSTTNRILESNGAVTGLTFPLGTTYHAGFSNQLLQFNGSVLNVYDANNGTLINTCSLPELTNFTIRKTYVKGTDLYLIGRYPLTLTSNSVIIKLNQSLTTAVVKTTPVNTLDMAVTNSGIIYLKASGTTTFEIGTFNWTTSVYSNVDLLAGSSLALFEYDAINNRMMYFSTSNLVKYIFDNATTSSFPITASGMIYTFPLLAVDYQNNEILITSSNYFGSAGGTINGTSFPYLSNTTNNPNVILHKISNDTPIASFTSNTQNVCPGNAISYTSTSSGGAISYNWTFPGGTPSTSALPNPVVTYCVPGTYNVSLTAGYCNGTLATTTSTNYVSASSANCVAPVCTGNMARRIGGSVLDGMLSTKTDAAGNIYSTGRFTGTVDFDPGPGVVNLTSATTNYEVYITKFDAAGNLLWARQLTTPAASTSPVNQADELVIDNAGDIILAGSFLQTVDFDPGVGVSNLTTGATTETFILKLNTCGEFVWARKHNGGGTGTRTRLAVAANNNVYIAGPMSSSVPVIIGTFTLNGAGNWDGYAACINPAGTFLWANRIGGSSADYYNDIAVAPSGNILLTGLFQTTADINPGTAIFNVTSAGGFDAFVTTLTSTGTFVWGKRIGNTGNDAGRFIAANTLNDVIVTGDYMGTVDLDPNAGVQNSTSVGARDIFIVRLTSAGNYLWHGSMGSTADNYPSSLAVDGANSVFISSALNGNVDTDPTAGVFNINSATGNFVTKVSSTNTFLWGRSMLYNSSISEMMTNATNDLIVCGTFAGTVDLDFTTNVITQTSTGSSDAFFVRYCAASVVRTGSPEAETTAAVELQGELVAYPNPANDNVTVTIPAEWGAGTIIVYNAVGQVVLTTSMNDGNTTLLTLSELNDGVYFINFTNNNHNSVTKLLKTTK